MNNLLEKCIFITQFGCVVCKYVHSFHPKIFLTIIPTLDKDWKINNRSEWCQKQFRDRIISRIYSLFSNRIEIIMKFLSQINNKDFGNIRFELCIIWAYVKINISKSIRNQKPESGWFYQVRIVLFRCSPNRSEIGLFTPFRDTFQSWKIFRQTSGVKVLNKRCCMWMTFTLRSSTKVEMSKQFNNFHTKKSWKICSWKRQVVMGRENLVTKEIVESKRMLFEMLNRV